MSEKHYDDGCDWSAGCVHGDDACPVVAQHSCGGSYCEQCGDCLRCYAGDICFVTATEHVDHDEDEVK